MEDNTSAPEDNKSGKKDKSLLYMGIVLGVIIMAMGYLTLFVDDPWRMFKTSEPPKATIGDRDRSELLNKSSTMSDEEVRQSLVKLIEAFYFDQRRGYFDPPSYFAPITETFYNFHNLTFDRLKAIYWKRRDDMENLKINWIVSSLTFQRVGQRVIASYWTKQSYLRPSRNQLESGDFQLEMTIDENGKIVSLVELNVRNFEATPLHSSADSLTDSSSVIIAAHPVISDLKQVNDASDELKIYDLASVDIAPEFQGGQKDLIKFISRKLRYPIQARENNTQGKVFIAFTVEKDGNLKDIRVLRGIGNGCDEEALRVLKASPAWKPGLIGGKPVRTSYVLPITFQLAD